MAEPKFTKGPWVPTATPGGWDGVREPGGQLICSLNLNNPANMTLIAASPELYEALNAIAWQWANHPREPLDEAIRAALPVLAKARGEP